MFQLCSALLGFQTIIFSILIPTNLVLAEERPKSALKWITVSEAEKLPDGFCNEDLVRFGEGPCIVREAFESKQKHKSKSKMFCKAMKDGCMYPGVALTSRNLRSGHPYTTCRIITKEKVYEPIDKEFQLLYNPNGAAQHIWRRWDQGTGNVNFPKEVVKTDEDSSCNFMLARYNNFNELGFVDSQGYIYFLEIDTYGVDIGIWLVHLGLCYLLLG